MTKTFSKYRTRVTILAIFLIMSWFGLCIRLFQVQILNGSQYQTELRLQSQKKQFIHANRGNIYDRKNRILTRNIIHYTLSVNPNKVDNKLKLAKLLSEKTGSSIEKYLYKLNSKSNFEYLERNLQKEIIGTIETSSYPGLKIEKNYRRYYPHKEVAAQILGFTNLDGLGISGIEKDFNEYLKGTEGWVLKTKGWSGKIQHKSGMPIKDPISGDNIQLTIDLEYQSILEEELLKRKLETDAVSATGIVMDPQTGEIYAIASMPGFNNNSFSKSNPNTHRIRAITDQFEPGSTFKVVSLLSVLKDESISLDDEFNCENGEYQYHSIPIRDHDKYTVLTTSQIIHHSSNIGVVKMIEKVGPKTLYDISRDFGFGSKTGISLNGEIAGKLNPFSEWSSVSLGQIAMGHEIGVTALQLATAYSAVANGGYLVKPSLIKQIIDHNNDIVYEERPSIIRKLADENTMKNMRDILRGVITRGTGKNAEIPGWKIAGKTGTAQKWKNGEYSNDLFISNFVGFFPYDDPQLLVFIMLDEPKQPYHWGSEGAAVAFRRIVKRIINMDDYIIPPKLELDNYQYTANDKNSIDLDDMAQSPTLLLSAASNYLNKCIVPELRGFSMRKAMSTLHKNNLKYNITGNGQVAWQSPKPGTIVDKETVCTIGMK